MTCLEPVSDWQLPGSQRRLQTFNTLGLKSRTIRSFVVFSPVTKASGRQSAARRPSKDRLAYRQRPFRIPLIPFHGNHRNRQRISRTRLLVAVMVHCRVIRRVKGTRMQRTRGRNPQHTHVRAALIGAVQSGGSHHVAAGNCLGTRAVSTRQSGRPPLIQRTVPGEMRGRERSEGDVSPPAANNIRNPGQIRLNKTLMRESFAMVPGEGRRLQAYDTRPTQPCRAA